MREAEALPPKSAAAAAESAEGGRSTAAGLRKKGAWVRAWLVVSATGQAEVVEGGKQAIMQRTGLPARDLRMLDPALSYPSTVLGRERAIVVNLENIKSIITSQEMIFQNSKDPLLTPFVQKIQGVFRHRQAVVLSQESGDDGNKEMWTNFYNSDEPEADSGDHHRFQEEKERFQKENKEGNAHELKILPFEFVALEACLEATCSSLDKEVWMDLLYNRLNISEPEEILNMKIDYEFSNSARRLEQEAHPALDKLTSKISTLNLDRVRHIKSRLVAITGRVQKVRDELEHLLDDDDDMAEMYLTEKLEEQELENSSTSSTKEQDIGYEEEDWANDETTMEANAYQTSQTRSSSIKNVDVEELEMILEAYFVQIEGTLNKLSALREYVEDTEDYINIMLDDKQNHLLQMGVMLTTATLVVGAFVALTGVFGMNIGIELFNEHYAGMPDFLWTVAGGTMGCILCFVLAMAWCRYKGLL